MPCTLPFRVDCRSRLMLLIFVSLVCVLVGSLLMAVAMGSGEPSAPRLRIATVIQDIFCFVLPAVATAMMVSPLPARLLGVDTLPSMRQTILAVAVMICSMPAMNTIVDWNASVTLPESLAGLEASMRAAEERAAASVDMMLGGTGVATTILAVLIVGLLAGLSEEIYFRGALQRLLGSGPMGRHAAVWTAALIFSLVHMQFYGFVPRVLLGAYFGYLLVWSGSLWLPILMHTLNNTVYVLNYRHPVANVDNFGQGDWALILASVILTFFLLRLFARGSRAD